MLSNNRDIVLALLLAVAMLVAVWLTDSIVLRTILALPLLFFMPGHLVMRACRIEWKPVERAMASLVLSIAICLLGCFVLYGIDSLTPMLWALWILAVVGALSAWIIWRGIPGELAIQIPGLSPIHACAIGIALLGTVGAYGMAIYDEASTREFSYTEFWLVPTKPGKLIVGIRNQEFDQKTYDLRMTTKTGVIAEIHSITLKPGEQWTRVVNSRDRTEAVLYADEDNQYIVYRQVSALPAADSDAER